ncbi:MAG: hypothetical protein GXO45_00060 [Aquificae bacterium]|nr:hypothetical protein [Aquificota bacterium]
MFLLLLLLLFFPVYGEYSHIPPFLQKDGGKPNLIIAVDFSQAVLTPVYHQAEGEVEYNKDKDYYGYFNTNSCYRYNTEEKYWYKDNCDCGDSRIGKEGCVNGNFLNYISSTKVDHIYKALIGGKGECGTDGCILTPLTENREYTITETKSNCRFKVEGKDYKQYITALDNGDKSCIIGKFESIPFRLKVENQPQGLAYNLANSYNITVFTFNSEEAGKIVYAYHQQDINQLVKSLQSITPQGKSYQGEALYEVMDFLTQKDNHPYQTNSGYVDGDNIGSEKDPFFNAETNSLSRCKRTTILLITATYWEGDLDPSYTAYKLHTQDLRADLPEKQVADVYTLTFNRDIQAVNSGTATAVAGSFTDIDGDNIPFSVPVNRDSKQVNFPVESCILGVDYKDSCKEWDKDGDGYPERFINVKDGYTLKTGIQKVVSSVDYHCGDYTYLGGVGLAGTGQELFTNGYVLNQTVYTPLKLGVQWAGQIFGYWYYIGNNTIREDTNRDWTLNPTNDYILQFNWLDGKPKIDIYTVNSSGEADSLKGSVNSFEETAYLFDTGEKLLKRSPDTRKVYTAVCNKGVSCMVSFDKNLPETVNLKDGDTQLNMPLFGFNETCLKDCRIYNLPFNSILDSLQSCVYNRDSVVDYIRGKDKTGYRIREINGSVWKLGDSLYSAPQVIRYLDGSSYIAVGSNDGMLHIFSLQKIEDKTDGSGVLSVEGENLGEELWAFIPRNALPYLQFLTDPLYKHTYYTDLQPFVFTTAEGRVILIGGMGFGGGSLDTPPPPWACIPEVYKKLKENCLSCVSDGFLDNSQVCSQIPYSDNYNSCYGYSSYFALDITDINNPVFLWEFSHPYLGFTNSGVAVVQKKDKTYIVIGSGATTYTGDTNQKLRLFVINLDGSNLDNPYIITTHLDNAFASRLFTKGLDFDGNGTTDYIFLGYSRKTVEGWKGGVLALNTTGDSPSYWDYTVYLQDSIPPVVSKIETADCFGKKYIYFGTGRWFTKTENNLPQTPNRLYGIPLSCDGERCVLSQTQTGDPEKACNPTTPLGWYIDLQLQDGDYLKERVIADPTVGDYGVVLFVSTKPTGDSCGIGGVSRLWALNCATGGSIYQQCDYYHIDINRVKGKVILPLTAGKGNILEIKGIDRSTGWLAGVPLPIPPQTVNTTKVRKGKVILWLEK